MQHRTIVEGINAHALMSEADAPSFVQFANASSQESRVGFDLDGASHADADAIEKPGRKSACTEKLHSRHVAARDLTSLAPCFLQPVRRKKLYILLAGSRGDLYHFASVVTALTSKHDAAPLQEVIVVCPRNFQNMCDARGWPCLMFDTPPVNHHTASTVLSECYENVLRGRLSHEEAALVCTPASYWAAYTLASKYDVRLAELTYMAFSWRALPRTATPHAALLTMAGLPGALLSRVLPRSWKWRLLWLRAAWLTVPHTLMSVRGVANLLALLRHLLYPFPMRAILHLTPKTGSLVDGVCDNVMVCGPPKITWPSFTGSPTLERFLSRGKVVCLSFGSMHTDAPRKSYALAQQVIRACGRLGLRCVWLDPGMLAGPTVDKHTGCSINPNEPNRFVETGGLVYEWVDPEVLRCGYVPHNWILPRCMLVVHHGGGAPVNVVFGLGVPSVVCPVLPEVVDQLLWAFEVERLGVGASVWWDPRLGAQMEEMLAVDDELCGQLVEAMRVASGPECLQRARELASRVREEQEASTECALQVLRAVGTTQ